MKRALLQGAGVALALGASGLVHAGCDIASVRQALPVRAAAPAPLSAELAGGLPIPGFAAGVFAGGADASLALDRVLLRQRLANCLVDEYADYAPRTAFDNTPWRFNAGGEGGRFDADQFDAWMKQRGVRIARGKPDATTPTATDAAAVAAALAVPVAAPSTAAVKVEPAAATAAMPAADEPAAATAAVPATDGPPAAATAATASASEPAAAEPAPTALTK